MGPGIRASSINGNSSPGVTGHNPGYGAFQVLLATGISMKNGHSIETHRKLVLKCHGVTCSFLMMQLMDVSLMVARPHPECVTLGSHCAVKLGDYLS